MSVEVEYSQYVSRYKNIVEDLIRDNLLESLNSAYASYFGSIPVADSTPQDLYTRIKMVLEARVLTWIYMINDKVIIEKLPPSVEGRISMKELASLVSGTYIEAEDCVVVSWDNFKGFMEKKVNRLKGILSI